MARRTGEDLGCMIFSCLFVFINTVTDWNIWWVEEKLEVAMLTRLIWPLITSSITIGCIAFSILSFKEYSNRTISRREHVSGAVQIDAAITGLHGVQFLISFIILASYTYYYYYSCTDQSKPTPVADESGLDGLKTVRAILGSSFASFIISVCRFIRKCFQSDDDTQESINILYVLIIIVNIIIMVFALWLRHVGVC